MILYFSATGNCKYVAERLAQTEEIVSIVGCLREKRSTFADDTIGIISPTYNWGMPSIVAEINPIIRNVKERRTNRHMSPRTPMFITEWIAEPLYNKTDPFGGTIGVTEGLLFYDESFGIAGITNASGSYSRLYITRNGGNTFEQIILPMEQVTELPEAAEEMGYTIEDYDYLNMPESDGDRLMIIVTTESPESDGIVFQSEDHGMTWEYIGIQ